MKNKLCSRLFLLLSFSFFYLASFAQDSAQMEKQKEPTVKSMIDEKTLTFEPEFATPMKGGRRYLDPGYTLKLKPDTLVIDLPYFGRAYSVDYGASDGGLKATSYKFEYSVKERKKGGWDITIKTKDLKDQLQMELTVFENGSASLNVNSTNRQPISYDGKIQVKK